jgi:hypothetical protein
MPKGSRVTVRLDDDVAAWLEAQAAVRGLDTAALIRMWIYERKNGIGDEYGTGPAMAAVAVLAAKPQQQPAPIERDYIDLSEPAEGEADPAEPDGNASSVDIDALVSDQLAHAEQAGLTAPRPEPEYEDDEQFFTSVRPLSRQGLALPRKPGKAWGGYQ